MNYLVTYQAYKKRDPNKQTELLFFRSDADNSVEAQLDFERNLIADDYELVKLISVVYNKDN